MVPRRLAGERRFFRQGVRVMAPVATLPRTRQRIAGAKAEMIYSPWDTVTVVDQPAPGRVLVLHCGCRREMSAYQIRIRPGTLGRRLRDHDADAPPSPTPAT